MKIIDDITLQLKIEKHLKKVNGGSWNLIERYTNGTALIQWHNSTRSYLKIIK